MITSFLGPCKSNKFVVDGGEVHITRCPQHLLAKALFTDPFSYIVEDTLRSHHQQFGCSTTSLLTMWYYWNEEFHAALMEGYDVSDVVEHSQKILDDVVSFLPQITINIKQLICGKQDCKETKKTALELKYRTYNSLHKRFCTSASDIAMRTSNIIPAGVLYSSRHYSPFQSNLEQIETNKANEDKTSLKNILTNEELKKAVCSVVRKLSHDDPESAELVSELWIRQISSTGDLKFCVDGIIICPLTLPHSYTSVVDGLIIKSKLLSWYDQELNLENKSLIIKGSITFEYVHLGYSSKVQVTEKVTPDEIQKTSKRDTWIKNCCDRLTKLQVNIVLVHGSVDDDIAAFCSSNSILLLSNMPWTTLEVICLAAEILPCTYLLDCDSKSIVSNLTMKRWNTESSIMSSGDQFFQICVNPSSDRVKPCTVVLCHPSQDFLNCQEHQLWHLLSRLNLASNELLPGGGKTEEWCFQLIKSFSFKDGPKAKISMAIANGFKKYSEFVNKKIEMKENDEAVDEMQSKIQAWRSALALALVILQCDSLLLNEPDNMNVIELDHNFVGFL